MDTHSSTVEGGAQFARTRWTLVLTACASDSPTAAKALAELCQLYWHPLYAYVRRRGYAPHDAQDLTQEFFARLIEKHKLARLTREQGKFRSFLLTALNHFLTDEWKRGQAQKRGAHQIVSLDAASAETRYRLVPADTLTPEKVFEKQWVLTLLDAVFGRLKMEYEAAGKSALFAELNFALTGDRSAVPYGELARRLGMSVGAVKVAVYRLRQRYREVLRAEVAETVAGPEDVEEELRELFRAVSGG
jgi:RNA polymerase sigma factor (sigma-70 family)